jgi:acyl dehydratase
LRIVFVLGYRNFMDNFLGLVLGLLRLRAERPVLVGDRVFPRTAPLAAAAGVGEPQRLSSVHKGGGVSF